MVKRIKGKFKSNFSTGLGVLNRGTRLAGMADRVVQGREVRTDLSGEVGAVRRGDSGRGERRGVGAG